MGFYKRSATGGFCRVAPIHARSFPPGCENVVMPESNVVREKGSSLPNYTTIKVVQEYERAVIFRLGRLLEGGAKGPGIFFVLPCIESYQKVDLRTITLGVPPQEVLTKDSVTVSVDAVVYYRVSNATVSVANVENAHH